MATTYVATLLASSTLYRARFMLRDVGALKDAAGTAIWLISDEEITAFITLYGFAEGVAQVADALAMQFAQEPSEYKDESGVSVKWGARIAQWNQTAHNLRSGAVQVSGLSSGVPLIGTSTGPDTGLYR